MLFARGCAVMVLVLDVICYLCRNWFPEEFREPQAFPSSPFLPGVSSHA